MCLFLFKPTSACLNSIHHKVGLTGKGVSRVYNPVIESVIFFIVLFPELLWPVKSSTNREKLVLESFSKSLSASCYLCCYVYIPTMVVRITERITALSPPVENSWQGTGAASSFPNNSTHLSWDLYETPALSKAPFGALGPPEYSPIQCLGLHRSITMQTLIKSPSKLCATVAKPSSLPCTELPALLNFLSP